MRPAATNPPVTPKGTIKRAPLPYDLLNPYIKNHPARLPNVKFQEIVRDGTATIVGRIKLQTPNGHAFILRRIDTGAVSLTTMFRAAFPTASDEAERAEALWVKNNFDILGANKSGKARFAGTWVTPDVAVTIAESYSLASIIRPLVDASPDPKAVYRKSSKQGGETPVGTPTAAGTPGSKDAQPPAAKRRRDASPSPAQAGAVAPSTPSRSLAAPATPGTRRSARLKSPAAQPVVPITTRTPKTPRTRQDAEHARTPQGSDITVVDDEAAEVAEVAQPNHDEDVREQKELIERLKAQHGQTTAIARDIGSEATLVMTESAPITSSASSKRLREEESVEFRLNIKEPETEERAVVSNSRVRSLRDMPPERKSLAWGALFFAAGMGAMTLLPSLPSFTGFL